MKALQCTAEYFHGREVTEVSRSKMPCDSAS